MKIVMPEYNTLTGGDINMSGLSKLGDVVVLHHPSREELKTALRDAEVLLVNKTVADEALLKDAKKLVYIGECATGYNNIDLAYCKAHGITVTNVPAYSTNAVAQQVFGYLLEFYGKTHDYNNFVQDKGWVNADTFAPFVFPTEELDGKTIGLVGYGSIGRKVGRIADAFGMNVLAYSRTADREKKEGNTRTQGYVNRAERYISFQTLENLLRYSDIVSIHCPLNADSEQMCNAEFFRKMKQGAFFINTARGPIVDESALADALKSGHLAGAGLDVLSREPMDPNCPLLKVENCIITPHIAWTPKETRQRLVNVVVKNLDGFLEGKPQNVVS